MSQSMEVTASNLGALTRQYQAITNNLANASTVAYKRQVSNFHRVLNSLVEGQGAPGSDGIGHGISNRLCQDFTQGSLDQTARSLDLAIEGKNCFFVIETPDGPRYTRNGMFRLNSKGRLVDSLGRTLAGAGGPITVPPNVSPGEIAVSRGGDIAAGDMKFGKIRLARFKDASVLKPVGHGCFQAPAKLNPETPKDARIHQGCLEQSNVNAVEELIKLIQVSRLYEAGIKSVNSQDERMKYLLRVASG